MNTNRKIITKKALKKRILAGSMALMVGAGMTGAYGYTGGLQVQAADTGKSTAKTAAAADDGKSTTASGNQKVASETAQLEKAAKNALGDSTADDNGKLYKDESVYVKADTSGKVTSTTVTEWLKNPEKGTVGDTSSLTDIRNIKGEETFTTGEDGQLSWASKGRDIYYQGTSEKKLPVDVNISYKLNGKPISAEDLKGKSGKVEIKIDYKNHSSQTVNVGGKNVEMYTPFTMVTALMLSNDEYSNVTIDNGKIVSDADKNIVLGVAFPGLKDDLGVQNLDIDLPESVTITADVKKATINPTVTVASTEIMDQFDLSDVKDFDDLADSMDQLEDAATQLKDGSADAADGSRTLSDGVNTLNSKSGELTKGVNDLAAGVNTYTSSVGSLADGSATVAAGAQKLDSAAGQIQGGITAAKNGADELVKNYVTAINGANNLSNGLGQLESAVSGTSSLGIQSQANTVAANTVSSVMSQLDGIGLTEEQKQAIADAYTQGISSAVTQVGNTADAGLSTQMTSLKNGIHDAKTGADTLSSGVGQLKSGTVQLKNGLDQLYTGSADLVKGTSSLSDGAGKVADGAARLNESSSLLTIGTKKLQDGGAQLASGVGQLAEGAGALADGNKALADGMSKFKEEGIDELTSIFDGDIKNVTDRLDAMTTLGQSYKSFAGIEDGMSGSTKFIIETVGIE